MDLRTGGTWRYEMQTDDGLMITFRGEYHEVVTNERIVFTEIYQAGPGATNDGGVQCTYSLAPDGDGTTLSMLTDAPDQATRDLIVGSGMEGGVQEGLDIAEEVAVGLTSSTSR